MLSAVRRGSRLDGGLRFTGYLLLAMPAFWLAAMAKEGAVWVNDAAGTRLLFTVGEASPDAAALSAVGRIADVAGHLVLPTLVLALGGYAAMARQQRAATLDVLDADYVRLARAKGLSRATVLRRHVLRTSLIPTTTLLAIVVSAGVSGAIVVEQVFGWRGLGTFLLEAIGAGDTFAVMGFVAIAGVVVVVANAVADALVGLLDPRTRRA